MRTHADNLTVAYVAIGASEAWNEATDAQRARQQGQLSFIDDIVKHALTLDRRADRVDPEYARGVFAYEVAEAFGREYGAAYLQGAPIAPEEVIARLVREWQTD